MIGTSWHILSACGIGMNSWAWPHQFTKVTGIKGDQPVRRTSSRRGRKIGASRPHREQGRTGRAGRIRRARWAGLLMS